VECSRDCVLRRVVVTAAAMISIQLPLFGVREGSGTGGRAGVRHSHSLNELGYGCKTCITDMMKLNNMIYYIVRLVKELGLSGSLNKL